MVVAFQVFHIFLESLFEIKQTNATYRTDRYDDDDERRQENMKHQKEVE